MLVVTRFCDCSWGDDGLEYDQNGPRQILVNWIKASQKVCTTFDFVTKGILQEAVKNTEVCLLPSWALTVRSLVIASAIRTCLCQTLR